jgi:hypothetical protein
MRMRNDSNPLSLIFSVILQSKELPSRVSTDDQALFTQRGSSNNLCFANWLLCGLYRENPINMKKKKFENLHLFPRDVLKQKSVDIQILTEMF